MNDNLSRCDFAIESEALSNELDHIAGGCFIGEPNRLLKEATVQSEASEKLVIRRVRDARPYMLVDVVQTDED